MRRTDSESSVSPRPGGDLRRAVRLFRRFVGDGKVYVAGVVLLMIEAVTAVIEPYPIAYLIDFLQGARESLSDLGAPQLLASERLGTILLLTLAIIGIAAINSAADSMTEVCMARGGRSLGYSIRVALYSHLQRLPLAYHDRRRTGDVLTRVTGDVLVVEDFVVKSVSNILGSLMVLVGSFCFLLYESWNVALVALAVVPLLAVISHHYSRRIKVTSRTQRDREGDLASTAQEMLTSIRLVQSYGRGTVDLERFSDQTDRSMRASLGVANIQAQFSFVIALTEAVAISAVVWLGVWLVDNDAITVGTLVLLVLLLQNMFKPARKIVSEWYKIGKVFASVDRIQDLLDREISVSDEPGAVDAPPLEGRLTFRKVCFAYPVDHSDGDAPRERLTVLRDVDFEIAPGEVVALVGPSGAGKSTIAQLVPRLYDADDGEILVDGLPVRGLTLASLRSQVTVVLQETLLLSGTVAENIGYGIRDATQEQIEAAARMANAHEFITGLPEGYATQLGERGATLSGGQRQRLAIARAFIRRAPILILDEPTNGLDRESAEVVVRALRDLMQGTTTILISHDSELVRCADRILAVSDGGIRPQEPFTGETAATGEDSTGARPPGGGSRISLPPLGTSLLGHLPDLEAALDHDFVAEQVRELMLGPGADVDVRSASKCWLREDGVLTLRYQLRLRDPAAPERFVWLLATLLSDATAGAAYLAESAARLGVATGGSPPELPFSTALTSVPDTGMVLHCYPLDPQLPTLAKALRPQVVGRLRCLRDFEGPLRATLVHHPRQGPAVVRYEPSDPDRSGVPGWYGKVYPSPGEVDRADKLLRSLNEASRGQEAGGARFPTPLGYDKRLRLLFTEALPGQPLIPGLLKETLLRQDEPQVAAALRAALRSAGHALATLHETRVRVAPIRTRADEVALLDRELVTVSRYWPDAAARVAECLAATDTSPEAASPVLCHGDFTPSQVLLHDGSTGLVDLDTLCLSDPAMDLGRFLAQLAMLVARIDARRGAELADNLTRDFLQGYGEAADRDPMADGEVRIRYYRTTSLARSALSSCRQLKGHRFDTALSLLRDAHPERISS